MASGHSKIWRRLRVTALFAVAAVVVFLIGNSVGGWINFDIGKAMPRVPLQGTISGAGGRDGIIRFTPLSDHGMLAVTEIKAGEFEFDESSGPSSGKYRVDVLLKSERASAKANSAIKTGGTAKPSQRSSARNTANQTGLADFDPAIEMEIVVTSDAPYRMELELPDGNAGNHER